MFTREIRYRCNLTGMNESRPWSFPPPSQPQVVAIAAAATELGIARQRMELLARSELARDLIGTEKNTAFLDSKDRLVIDRQGLDALLEVPQINVEDLPPTVNVRVQPARDVDDDDRKRMGWHSRLTAEERDLGVTRWWSKPRHAVIGWPFIATIGGFVVYHGRITDLTIEREQVSYTVDTTDTEAEALYKHKRIQPIGGGVVIYLGV
ncbi:hypothetical protein [Prescottella subtropica]|uniref:hypothetical protein n=1 Tax=Prescottella subtropica TaxID=2545757 RepID=UPI0010F46936|nr:hypothetical protein [Prescottella subtropica]